MPHRPDDHGPAGDRAGSASRTGGDPRAVAVLARAAATAALVAALVGCAPADAQAPAPGAGTTTPAPPVVPAPAPATGPAAALPDVPVRSAALDSAAAAAVVPPASLAVPSLGIALPVDPVGVQEDGQMEIPPLAERAGWYRYGAAPGAPAGTAVVAAHVDSVASAGLGPFARLPDVALGAVVDVTLADGTTRQYAVTDVTRQAKPEISWADVFVRDGAHRLVLVTCGGTFQREVGHYSDNVIVTAEPLGG